MWKYHSHARHKVHGARVPISVGSIGGLVLGHGTFVPGPIVKNGEERLVVLNDIAKLVVR